MSCNAPRTSESEAGLTVGDTTWTAPDSVIQVRNPHTDQIAISAGETLYNIYCWSCHGETGLGDGAAGGAMGSKPANFQEDRGKAPSDGALFWKISDGRGTMPSFAEALSEEQR